MSSQEQPKIPDPPKDMSDREVDMFHGHLVSLWQKMQNLPLAVRQQLGLKEESEASQNLGDMIDKAYNQIENAIDNLPDDATMSDKKKQLMALRITVPYHYTLGQKDENWLNDAINAIIGQNVSSVVAKNGVAVTPEQQIAAESSTSHEDVNASKPPQQEA